MKKARKPKCKHGNRPTKAKEGTGGIVAVRAHMQEASKTPCVECPLRRDSVPGYLGGYTPEMYVEMLHGPASVACHKSPGFQERQIERQRHCTGVAAYRANVGHITIALHPVAGYVVTSAHDSTVLVGEDRENYFASPLEFVRHHIKGQKEKPDTE
jgi:hypothetical protein